MARDVAREAARHSGLPVGAAFAMIRKDIQELRREASRPQVEPAVLEQRLHELAVQIGALQETALPGSGAGFGLDTFLNQLNALLAQNLAMLRQQVATTTADAISGPAESIRRDVASLKQIQASVDRRTQDTFEAVYGTIERIVDRLAAIEEELQERSSESPAGPSKAPSRQTPPADDADRSGPPGVRSDSAPAPDAPNLTQMQAPVVLVPTDDAGGTVILRRPAVLPNMISDAVSAPEGAKQERDVGSQSGAAGRAARTLKAAPAVLTGAPATARPHGKAAILGVGAAVLMLVVVALALDFYRTPADPADDPMPVARMTGPQTGQDAEQARGTERSSDQTLVSQDSDRNPPPFADGAAPAAASPAATVAMNPTPADGSVWDPDALIPHVPLPVQAGRDPWPQSAPSAGSDLTPTPLPPAIGNKTLIAAAQAGDPGASYEIAIRFAQGRNAAPDLARSAMWLERAAQVGLAPAQFRLGSMYEKGLGVRKDFAEARRLYMAAAAKGHAKAMHNLAVLYTHSIDGAADYGAAVEWFRKAAAYGTIDSAYNLGILYARGAGVERDPVESYKWFALAAKSGDRDAAHKRDEVAKGLDPVQLESAKASAEAFVAVPQPDEATSIKAPAGGWDQVAAAATTKSKTFARPERFPGR